MHQFANDNLLRQIIIFFIFLLPGVLLPEENAPRENKLFLKFYPVISYQSLYSNNLSGGKENGSIYLGNLTLGLKTVHKFGNSPETTLLITSVHQHDSKDNNSISSDYTGGYTTSDNLDDRKEGFQVGEYWIKQDYYKRFEFKIGRQDASKDFLDEKYSNEFLNSGFQTIPTVQLPRYQSLESRADSIFGGLTKMPVKKSSASALGIFGAYTNNDFFKVKAGIYDGRPDPEKLFFSEESKDKKNVSALLELLFMPEISLNHKVKGFYCFGLWFVNMADYTEKEKAELPTHAKNMKGSGGLYFAADQMIFKEKEGDENEEGLSLFFQYGNATPNWSILHYFGGGATYKGAIPKRNKDVMGLAASLTDFTVKMSEMFNMDGQEIILEAFYKLSIIDLLFITTDFQRISVPKGISDPKDPNYATDSYLFMLKGEISL